MTWAELEEKKKELAEIEKSMREEELNKRRIKAKEKVKEIKKYKDVILEFLEHDSTDIDHIFSSSYNYDSNDRLRIYCRKCLLKEIINDEWCDDHFEITFNVDIEEIK